MTFYNVKTQEDYDALMHELDVKGYRWSEEKPLNLLNAFNILKEKTVINTHESILKVFFWDIDSVKKPIVEYKAKGENMLNTECKQCHKKWHHDNANYCSMCGNELVDEPEFKSGDIVASKVFSDCSFGLVRLNEDLLNRFTSVDGFWYTKRDCDIYEMSLGVFKEDTRHATPEEIAEYEAALTFHKNGREPFEVKRGDIVYLKGYDKNIFLDSGNIYKKHNFVDGDVVLIKTAEEVNEWLGADDE